MILSNKRITKVLIRLRGCTGWSAPLLFANKEDMFSCNEAHISAIYNLQPDDMLKISFHIVHDITKKYFRLGISCEVCQHSDDSHEIYVICSRAAAVSVSLEFNP